MNIRYGEYRATLYAMAVHDDRRTINRHRATADKATYILTQIVAERGVSWANANQDLVLKYARQRFGLLASIWPTIAVALLKLLLPILLQWLTEQMVQLKASGGKPSMLDETMRNLAFEAERTGAT